ncbi:MAG TPA: ChaN family lipoprotein [Thermohalobaculum sp.]|nr:ChaN family lipoprotein [Thermohalobaculum sp.]
MRRILACLALAFTAACALPGGEAAHPIIGPGGARLSEAELVEALGAAQVVVLGEVHDNAVHHARQARLVRALGPAGLAFEMVPEGSEEGIAVFRAQGGAPAEIGPAIGWERLGWPDWALYSPVFEAAPDAYIAGGGPARAEIRVAVAKGAAAAWGAGSDAVGLDSPPDAETRRRLEDEMIAAHCDRIARLTARAMLEAQRFKDARLAEAALRALERGGGRAILVTGNGHARTDRGAPAYLRSLAPGIAVASVGMIELPLGADPLAQARGLPFDYVWFSDPHRRGDPCEGFG